MDALTEVEERIARLQQLLDDPAPSECECEQEVLRHHLLQLRQLRAEETLDAR